MLKLTSCVLCINRSGQKVELGSEANAGAGLLPSPQGSPCPLLPAVLGGAAFLALSSALSSPSTSSSVPCSLGASACCPRDPPFASCTGQLLSSFLRWGAARSSSQGGPEPAALSRPCVCGQGCCSLLEALLRLRSSFPKISL